MQLWRKTWPKPQTNAIKQVSHLAIDMRTAQNQFAFGTLQHKANYMMMACEQDETNFGRT